MAFFLSIKFHSFGAIFLCVYGIIATITNADEIKDNSFEITFVDITTNTWNNEGKEAKFTNAIANITRSYCSSNYDKCGLKFWNSTRVFKSSHVKISSGYPKQLDNDLQIQFHVELPSGLDIRKNSTTLLPLSAIKTIIKLKGSTLNSWVGVTVKTNGNATSKPKVDNKLNYIMIPVSFGLLLLVILLALCLHCCHKRKMEEIKAAEQRQYTSKQKTNNSNSQSPFHVSPAIPHVAVKPQRRDDSEPYVHYEDERINHYDVTTQNNVKPGEKQIPEETAHRRKKKKSTKRTKHKDNTEENVNNNHVNQGCEVVDGQNQHVIHESESEQERQPATEWKKKKKRHKRTVESQFAPESGSENEVANDHETDQEREPPKERKKKKKRHHKRRVESPLSHDSDESDKETGNAAGTNEDDDILSKLPPPRKLPPLRG